MRDDKDRMRKTAPTVARVSRRSMLLTSGVTIGTLALRGGWTTALAKKARAQPENNWKSLITVADAKRDPQGNLLPLQSYDETIRRGMAFILQAHPAWFKGRAATLQDEICGHAV
jgi:hypothetical protein